MTTEVKKTRKPRTVKIKAAQIDGKVDIPSTQPNQAYGSLDHILGENTATYSSRNVEEYRAFIADLNQTDLQTHAQKVGLIPVEDRRILVARLVDQFNLWAAKYQPQGTVGTKNNLSDLSKTAQQILREGA